MIQFPAPYMRRSRFVVGPGMPYDIYIGRPSRWGNTFSHKSGTLAQFRVATRELAVAHYAKRLMVQPVLLAAIPSLRGQRLKCWCDYHKGEFNPLLHLCHGHVLAWLANPEDYM